MYNVNFNFNIYDVLSISVIISIIFYIYSIYIPLKWPTIPVCRLQIFYLDYIEMRNLNLLNNKVIFDKYKPFYIFYLNVYI